MALKKPKPEYRVGDRVQLTVEVVDIGASIACVIVDAPTQEWYLLDAEELAAGTLLTQRIEIGDRVRDSTENEGTVIALDGDDAWIAFKDLKPSLMTRWTVAVADLVRVP